MTITLLILGLLLLVGVFLMLILKNEDRISLFQRTKRILLTNWIHFVGLYIFFSLTTLIDNFVFQYDSGYSQASIYSILFEAPLLLAFYTIGQFGMIIFFIFITDIIAFTLKLTNIILLTLGQWLIVSSVLEYIMITEMKNIVWEITLPIMFLLTQILRAKQLKKIKNVA